MILALLSLARSATVTTSAEWRQACLDATADEVIEVDSSAGRLTGTCSLSAPGVQIRPVEGLDYGDVGIVELLDGGDRAILERLTFDPGSTLGAQIDVAGAEDVIAEDVHFTAADGYGVGVSGGSIHVMDCTASGWPQAGAPIVLYPETSNASAVVERCTFRESDGGVAVIGTGSLAATVTIRDSVFEDQLSLVSGLGGGVQVYGSEATAIISGTTFRGAQVDPYGGGVGVDEGGYAEVRDCTFEDNQATAGADVFVRNGTVLVEDSVSTGATAQFGAFKADEDGQMILRDVRIVEPTAFVMDLPDWPTAAGVMAHGHHTFEAHGLVVCGAEATSENSDAMSAVLIWEGDASISSSVFQHNSGEGATIAAVGATLELDHASLVNNRDPLGVAVGEGASLTVTNSVFWEVAELLAPGVTDGGYNAAISDMRGLGSVRIDDPGFEDSYDMTDCDSLPYLAEGSPLIDAADPSTTDEDGTRADIGALPYGSGTNEQVELAPGSSWLTGGCPAGAPAGALVLIPLLARARREGPRGGPGT